MADLMDGAPAAPDRQIYRFGPFRLEVEERLLYRDGTLVPLAGKSFDLLLALLRAPGRLQSREQLIAALWPKTIVEEANLTWNVNTLRKALGDDPQNPRYIETVRGHGYRFIEPVDPPAEPAAPAGRPALRWLWTGTAVAALVAAAIVAWLWWPMTSQPVAQAAHVPPQSIAVLPFENLSADRNNAYFTAGIQDEILTRLASIGALKVIARTSTRQYASHPADLKTIARQLGVATILEGSVQKVGNLVHVNVQLIDAQTYAHIWAHSYNRKLIDIFGVEAEVAEKIADALNAKLTSRELALVRTRPTRNPAAYDAYLRGLAYVARGSPGPHNYNKAAYYFEQAIKLDPGFALAWGQLAVVDASIYYFGYDATQTGLANLAAAADRAVALAPEIGESWLAEGYYLYYGLHQFDRALTALERARKLLPNNADVMAAIAYVKRRQGHWSQALALQRKAAAIDPRNFELLVQTALTEAATRQFAQAHTSLKRALDLVPDSGEALATDAAIYQAGGDLDEADKRVAQLQPEIDNFVVFGAKMRELLYRRNYPAAIAALEPVVAQPHPALGDNIGYYYVLLGLAQRRAGDAVGARRTYLKGRSALLALRRAGDDSDRLATHLGLIEAGLGDAAAAKYEGRTAVKMTRDDEEKGPGMLENLARIDVQLGDDDAALAILSRLLQISSSNLMTGMPLTPALLRLDPAWDPLRSDPRFQAMERP